MAGPIDDQAMHASFMASSRRHVLNITNHGIHQWDVLPGLPDTGGQNVFVNQFSEALARLGFRVTIVNRGGYPHPRTGELRRGLSYRGEHLRILFLEDSRDEFVRKEEMAAQIPELVGHLGSFLEAEQSPVDLILSHYWDGAQVGVLFSERFAEPVDHIWIPHSLGTIKKRNMPAEQWGELRIDERIALERELLPRCRGVGATSRVIQEALESDYGCAISHFIPPCVDPGRYHPRAVDDDDEIWSFLAGRAGRTEDEVRGAKIITEISRTDHTKRKDLLLRAFALAQAEHPDSFLVIAVDESRPALSRELHQLIDELGLTGRVAPVGSVWDILPTLYAITDIYCTPSVMEGFGMSIQEAAASGAPAVSSDLVPFAVEYLLGEEYRPPDDDDGLQAGLGGIVVRADDEGGFARALSMLLSDEPLRKRMGERAHRITVPYFTWTTRTSSFLREAGIAFEEQRPIDRLELRSGTQRIDEAQIDNLSFSDLARLVEAEPGLSDFRPDGVCQIDPRNQDRVVFNSSRARRPHDNAPVSGEAPGDKACLVCEGATTAILDIAPLSKGFTFINKNLYPGLYPGPGGGAAIADPVTLPADPGGLEPVGFHLLQWSSSIHDRDWHNMPSGDREIVMGRLAALERVLLTRSGGHAPDNAAWGVPDTCGHVLIIKNHGHLVGGSLAHGHQQIVYSNIMPRRLADDLRFERERGEPYAKFILRENPRDLLVRDYGPATLVVPYFMRRPYDMQLVMRDTSRRYLHQLDDEELGAAAQGWRDAIRAIRTLMPAIGKETAYNVVTHNGPGAGLYFEFLPYTQETGGYEHLGLIMCQADPRAAAARLRELIAS